MKLTKRETTELDSLLENINKAKHSLDEQERLRDLRKWLVATWLASSSTKKNRDGT
jgi:hypothetical protein